MDHQPIDVLFESLSISRRRRVLAQLRRTGEDVRTTDLALRIAAAEADVPLVEVSEESHREVRVSLHHNHLPAMADADLIERADGRVSIAADELLENPIAERFLADPGAVSDLQEDRLRTLANERRRTALSVLTDRGDDVDRRELARAVVAADCPASEPIDQSEIERCLISLHHVDLPTMADADLIRYDADEGVARATERSVLGGAWLDASVVDDVRETFSAARGDGVWSIEGRDNVIARGQALLERADDEIFLMITTDGLLREGCVARIQDAADRGVDVYVGSQTPAVREFVREHVPEATIWEPQMDWLNLPPTRERLGRLLFVDREAIMLGSLGEETTAGHPSETAITGEGRDNSLVILMRELLGSRIDHLDEQSPDFLDQIPL